MKQFILYVSASALGLVIGCFIVGGHEPINITKCNCEDIRGKHMPKACCKQESVQAKACPCDTKIKSCDCVGHSCDCWGAPCGCGDFTSEFKKINARITAIENRGQIIEFCPQK